MLEGQTIFTQEQMKALMENGKIPINSDLLLSAEIMLRRELIRLDSNEDFTWGNLEELEELTKEISVQLSSYHKRFEDCMEYHVKELLEYKINRPRSRATGYWGDKV
jgi:hypothetical protein